MIMAKKPKRAKTFARTASKSMEKQLVTAAKELMQDPYRILPSYDDADSQKYFDKIKKKLDKIHRFRDDVAKLEKLSNKTGLPGALAGTLLLAHSEKAPYLAVARFSDGDVTYAQRGRAEKEKLIAVQHFDDPVLRILGIKDFTLKHGLHVFSWKDGFVSTGRTPRPPSEFVDFVLKKLGLTRRGNTVTCDHLTAEDVREGKITQRNYIKIHWQSADIYIGVCESCAQTSKNTMLTLSKYLLYPNLSSDFTIDVVGQLRQATDSSSVQETQFIDKYLSGELTDKGFIANNVQKRRETLQQAGEKLLVLDGVSYGTDVKKFIEALHPNSSEEKGLTYILEKIDEPLVVKDVTPNKVLEVFWKTHGLETLEHIVHDKKMAKELFALDDTPSTILEIATSYRERQNILAQLPRYRRLPPLANFADHLAKTYRTFGEKKSLSELRNAPDTPKGKALSYAFFRALGKGEDKKWKFSEVELEYGEFLKDYVQRLLEAKPEDYHAALKEVLAASGSTESIDGCLIS
jgi:hypothetical protein